MLDAFLNSILFVRFKLVLDYLSTIPDIRYEFAGRPGGGGLLLFHL